MAINSWIYKLSRRLWNPANNCKTILGFKGKNMDLNKPFVDSKIMLRRVEQSDRNFYFKSAQHVSKGSFSRNVCTSKESMLKLKFVLFFCIVVKLF